MQQLTFLRKVRLALLYPFFIHGFNNLSPCKVNQNKPSKSKSKAILQTPEVTATRVVYGHKLVLMSFQVFNNVICSLYLKLNPREAKAYRLIMPPTFFRRNYGTNHVPQKARNVKSLHYAKQALRRYFKMSVFLANRRKEEKLRLIHLLSSERCGLQYAVCLVRVTFTS